MNVDSSESVLHVAGLLVVASTPQLDAVARQLSALRGVTVHGADAATGRLVVTVETDSMEAQQAVFAAVSRLPGVGAVSLVCHQRERLSRDEATSP